MDFYTAMSMLHIVGTVLGVGGATMIETNLRTALHDGTMTPEERPFISSAVFITRIGMALTLATGIGFVVTYLMNDMSFRLANGIFWVKMMLFVIIVMNAILLAKHWVSLYWGSAFSFVSWWGALCAGLFLSNGIEIAESPILTFGIVISVYGCALVCGAWALHRIRMRGATLRASA